MRYLVKAIDGQFYGPIEAAGLRQWVIEGRISPQTILVEDGTGREIEARFVPGLFGEQGGLENRFVQQPPTAYRLPVHDARTSIIYSVLGLLVCGICIIPAFYYAGRARRNREPAAVGATILAWLVAIIYIASSIFIVAEWDRFQKMLPNLEMVDARYTKAVLPASAARYAWDMNNGKMETGTKTWREKVGLAEMLKGGVIMDVVNVEQAKIAEDAGAVAVMALERVPADIRRDGGVSRMSDPEMILDIKAAVTIPVMAKCRIGHFVEAEILEALEVDFIDESEVLTPADEENHVDKHGFTVPFVCGARNLGEALRRCAEGAAMIRTKGEAGTGDVVEAVRHMRTIQREMRTVQNAREDELYVLAKEHQAPLELIRGVHATGKLPVPNFSAGGIATPADAALMMKLGAETCFVGSGIFKSGDPARRAKAIVESVLFYKNAKKLGEISRNLGEPMVGINVGSLGEKDLMAGRGW